MSKKYLIGNTESNTQSNTYKENFHSNLLKGKLFINGCAYPVDIIDAKLQTIYNDMTYELGGNSRYINPDANKIIVVAEINEPCLIEHASQSISEAINNNTINVIF